MEQDIVSRFGSELDSFFVLALLNMAFGALAMAFGMQFIIASVLGLPQGQVIPELRLLGSIVSLIGFGLGLSWIISSTKILREVKEIRREFRKQADQPSGEALTGWIVRMLAHYRKNRKIVSWMITVCRLGGCAFVTLGIVNLLQGLDAGSSAGGLPLFPFIAAAINLTIGIATIMISIGFHRYSFVWDQRLEASVRNEGILEEALEQR